MKETIKDFGEWNLPTSWDEVTLEMFQKIEKYYSDKDKNFDVREVLDIFTSHTKDEINELPIEFTEKLMNKLSFLTTQPNFGEPKPSIEIDGEKYTVNVMEKLKTGEYVAVDTVIKADQHNYAAMLAILCRKDGEIYDSKFEAEVFEDRQKLFEKQPITKVMPIVSFFLELYAVRTIPSQLYSEVEAELNHIQKSIETSEKLGVFKRRSLNSRMKKLRKLLESNKSI